MSSLIPISKYENSNIYSVQYIIKNIYFRIEASCGPSPPPDAGSEGPQEPPKYRRKPPKFAFSRSGWYFPSTPPQKSLIFARFPRARRYSIVKDKELYATHHSKIYILEPL